MDLESTISAYQGVLSKFEFQKAQTASEDFAQKRFLKKMEVPDRARSAERRRACWLNYITKDSSLPHEIVLPSPEWYKARTRCHQAFSGKRLLLNFSGFGPGSSYEPTRGQNSIEARLASNKWSCTPDAFEAFASMVYRTSALKKAFRRRYNHWFHSRHFKESKAEADRILYKRFARLESSKHDIAWNISLWKLSQVTTFVHGSRFSTVSKNNEKDRPINIEPLGNLLVQRSIGKYIREILKFYFGVDLDILQEVHRGMIKIGDVATIDLSDASDSVSIALCYFLLPRWLFRKLMAARSPMLFGLDRDFHLTRKISSMGNGFTFELMTIILLSLCRVLDPQSSVYGDDIIIKKDKAHRLIKLLEEVGFSVNLTKTHIDDGFRESCGANYSETEGYIKSYDFRYPTTIADCIVSHNKAYHLGVIYPSFKLLWETLHRFTPKSLRGPISSSEENLGSRSRFEADRSTEMPSQEDFELWFESPDAPALLSRKLRRKCELVAAAWQHPTDSISAFIGFKFIPELRSKTVKTIHTHRHWAKYLMYLAAGRVSDDVITDSGGWAPVKYLSIGSSVFRASDLERYLS